MLYYDSLMNIPRPKEHTAKITNIQWENQRDLEIEFLVDDKEFTFIPGQYVNINVGELKMRSYSLCSSYLEKGCFTTIISVQHDGPGSRYFKSLKIGDEVNFIGPSGRFVLREPYDQNILFVVTGTGITAFLAMSYKLQNDNVRSKIYLLHGIRHEDEKIRENRLKELVGTVPDFGYSITVSRPKNAWEGLVGRVSNHISVENPNNTQIYICGHPEMVEDVKSLLLDINAPESKIFFEKYTNTVRPDSA